MVPRRVELLPSFEVAFESLAPDIQARVVDVLGQFSERTSDNALRPELKNGFENVWSIRVSKGYRAFYKKLRDADGAIFCMFHVGHHDDYRVLKRLAARINLNAFTARDGGKTQSVSVKVGITRP